MTGLLQFTERPDAGDSQRSYPILRCDAEQKYRLSGFILSTHIFGVNVHYVGKSVPCAQPKASCTWCDAGRPLRWVGYAPACDLDRHKMFLFEFTPGVMPAFEAFLTMHDGLRGCYVNLTRRKPRPNARLEVAIQPAGKYVQPGDLPTAFDVESVLERIYGLTGDPDSNLSTPGNAALVFDRMTESTLARAGLADRQAAKRWEEGAPEDELGDVDDEVFDDEI